jgi:adenylate cyclase
MSDAIANDVLRLIQKTIAAETGIEVGHEVSSRLHTALSPAFRWSNAPFQGGLSQEVTVLLADLRGFTAIFESHKAATVLKALNRFLARMCEIAVDNGGTIDKFLGDAIMVLFGAPQGNADDARRAVTCAVQMQNAMVEINRENADAGLPFLYMGAAINTGDVMAALLGSVLYSEYTVIGSEVNIVSRIEAFTLRGQVLISERTFDRCSDFVTVGQPMDVRIKGKSEMVRLREVLAIPSLGLQSPRQDMRKALRVETKIPFTYQLIVDKLVMPQTYCGRVVDLAYEGMMAEVEPDLTQYTEILAILDLSPFGGGKHDVYAKVCSTRVDQQRHYAGIEFTSLSPQGEKDIRHLVQLLIQGSAAK